MHEDTFKRHPVYITWIHMIRRCEVESCPEYKHYGERGITICPEWRNSFITFFEWSLRNGWYEGLSIDRIDVNGNYEPSNCRWTTMLVQQNNKRNNSIITFEGRTQTEAQWCREMEVSRGTIGRRLKNGWSIEAALTIPSKKHKYNEMKRMV